ncbi:MAG TPA: response regulator transcription factor [Blastocatellia bacterium]|nr:response regulator transcription factor [Blastocatellia bacterium]
MTPQLQPTNDNWKVLVVDDQKVSRDSIKAVINLFPALKLEGEVGSGEEALEFVGKRQLNLVLMDLNLPGINGIEATRRLKEFYPELVVFIVSSNPPELYREAAFAAGASQYISKSQIRVGLTQALFL